MRKNYVTLQEDIKDCGAACLSSVMKYYGGYVPMEKIKEDCSITKDGISAYHLIETAKKYGFESYGIKIKIEQLKEITLPAILHFQYPNGLLHYVVLYKITKEDYLIMDPKCGMVKMKKEEFLGLFHEIVIILKPITSLPTLKKSSQLSHLILSFYHQFHFSFLSILFLSGASNLLLLLSSLYVKIMMSGVGIWKKETCFYFCGLFLLLLFLEIFTLEQKNKELIYLNKDLDIHLSFPYLMHIFKIPLSVLSLKTTGEVLTRYRELEQIKDFLANLFVVLITDGIEMIFSLGMIYFLFPKLFLPLLFLLLVYYGMNYFYSKRILPLIQENLEKDSIWNGTLVEQVDHLETIKNISEPIYFKNKLEEEYGNYGNSKLDLNLMLTRCSNCKNFLITLGRFVLTTLAIYLVYQNKMTWVNFMLFITLLEYPLSGIKGITDLQIQYFFCKKIWNKVSEFLDVSVEEKSSSLLWENGLIQFKNVSFSYNSIFYPIKHLNLTIFPKEKIFLKGRSGTGKSTLCKILYRYNTTYKGIIKINDFSLEDYSIESIRKNIVYVSQDEKLFQMSLLENITLNRQVLQDQLKRIVDICKLQPIIDKLPMHGNTLILEESSNLSGGEKQRIILARALVKESPILLLDEALSQVDYKTECSIIKDILAYFKDRTILYISHKEVGALFERTVMLK